MNRRRLLITLSSLAATAAFVLALVVPLASSAHAAPLPPGARPYGGTGGTSPWCTEWHIMPNPQPSGMSAGLDAVAADAANDVWAVGVAYTSSVSQTLVEHYDGSSWSIVSSPNAAGTTDDEIHGVVALAANNVWAVGWADTSTSGQTLIEHYNGTSWSVVASPNMSGATWNALYRLAADAANDIWAVGTFTTSTGTEPLTEHYNGSSWSIVSAVGKPNFAELDDVSVVSGQAFAAGDYTDSSGVYHTLVEHYASGSWSLMTTPDSGTTGSTLGSAAAISPTNVWAAGATVDLNGNFTGGLIEHWDGSAWSVVATNSSLPAIFWGLAAVPGTANVWAVGDYSTSNTTASTFVEQWQGYVWNPVTSATPANASNVLNDAAAVSTTDAWAVGFSDNFNAGTNQSLIEHYAGPPAGLFCP